MLHSDYSTESLLPDIARQSLGELRCPINFKFYSYMLVLNTTTTHSLTNLTLIIGELLVITIIIALFIYGLYRATSPVFFLELCGKIVFQSKIHENKYRMESDTIQFMHYSL